MEQSSPYEPTVECCGVRVPCDVAEVQHVMTLRGLDASAQAYEWLRLGRSYPEPSWMERCVAQARHMAELVRGEQEVLTVVGGSVDLSAGATGRRYPTGPLAERQFEWLGDRRGVPVEVVRDGIAQLAARGFVSRDAEQQAALRRGLGLTVNAAERSSRAPWVRWMGEGDALNYLVDSLWRLELIHCTGGQRYKWQTLCGVFLRSDGSRFEPSIKSNRCTNNAKRRAVDEAMLGALRFISK